MNSRLTKLVTWGLAVVAGALMAWNTSQVAPDFMVYFEAARRFWSGLPIYPCTAPEVMAFKYPPWIFPFFAPFGLLSPLNARWAWGGVQALSLLYVVSWLMPRVRAGAIAVSIIVFWGLLSAHAFDGQITLTLLAIGLWSFGKTPAALLYPFSAKIFTAFALLGRQWKSKDVFTAAFIAFLFVPLSFPALRVSPENSWLGLFRCWQRAAGTALDENGRTPITVLGDQAQGFVSLVARAIHLDVHNVLLTLVIVVGIAIALAIFWRRQSRNLSPAVQWAGWLALTATVQPLAGFHSFVFALPLAAMVLDGFFKQRRQEAWWLPLLGLACVALLTQKTLGPAGLWLQWLSIKSWGVLILCLAAGRVARSK